MTAIFKKEFRSYLHSVTGWIFMAVTVCFFAMYSSVYNLAYGTPYIAFSFDAVLILFFITVPLLSMRIMAEERRQKTDQLLITSPVSVGKIVLGKYLAMAAVFLIPLLFFSFLPLFLSSYGTVPMAENFVAILAFALYGLAAIAVGLFLSSLTENVVIAAVLTFIVLFLTYMMQGIESLISTTGNMVTKILSAFDFYTHYGTMIRSVSDVAGNSRLTTVFDLTGIVYFLSVIILMLFLTTQSVQKRRYTVSVKTFAMGAYSSAATAAVIALAVGVNFLAAALPAKYTQLDVTTNKLYGITEQTREIVSGLSQDVNIYVYAAQESADGVLAQTLERYQELSRHIKVSYVDPLQDPNFAAKYTAEELSQNSLIVETDKRSKVVNYYDLYETQTDYATYSQAVTGYDGEGQLTSAISYCTSDDMPKIYFIAGHGEYTFDSGFLAAIEKENIAYETISLLEQEAIPEDAKCVIIHAPENDFSADDADKVIAYLNNGGMVFLTTEYVQEQQSNFERILSEFGMTLQRGMVAENNTANYYQEPFYLLPDIEAAEETAGLTGQHQYIMSPFAQGVTIPENSVEGMTYTKLLTTSDKAVLKSGKQQVTTYEKEEGDLEGPFCLGVKAQKELDAGTGTLYVFTSAQMFTDYYDSAVAGNNKQLFSNIMGTIAGHEVRVSVPVKSYELPMLTVPIRTAYLYRAVFMVIVPLGLLAAGLAIWMVRRKK